MTNYDHIALIYNPISTNDAEGIAKDFQRQLKEKDLTATLVPTKRPGHGKELAAKIASKYDSPLIISVSGDGGYNEIINGVMAGPSKGNPTLAILAAGNANDHKRLTRGERSLIDLIEHQKPKNLDILHLQSKELSRYAHSYIGLGVSPIVGVELNRNQLNWFKEIQIVLSTFMKFKPFTIIHQDKKLMLDSLVFANINGMAKILKFAEKTKVHDGKFELLTIPHKTKLHLLWSMLRSTISSSSHPPQYASYAFTTTAKTPVQLDGEIEQIEAHQKVTVSSVHGKIKSLY